MDTASSIGLESIIGVTDKSGGKVQFGGGVPCLFFDPFSNYIPLPVMNAVFNVVFILAAYLSIVVFWYVLYYKKSMQERNQRIIVTILIFTFMVFSQIVKVFFKLFSCSTFVGDENFRLQSALDVICYSGEHFKWISTVGLLTGLLLILLPGLAVKKLYAIKKDKKLDSSDSLETYG